MTKKYRLKKKYENVNDILLIKSKHRYCVVCGTDLGEYKVDILCPNCGFMNE